MTPAWPLAVLLTVAALIPATADAQGREWWRDAEVQRELALTAEQVSAIDMAFRHDLPARRALRQALSRAQAEFDRAVAAGDEAAALAVLPRVVDLGMQQNRGRTITLLRMSWVLSDDQRTRLRTLRR